MSFIKKHKLLSLILFLVPIFIIAILRFYDYRFYICITTSDWVALVAGLFTYYGTVILAIVTVSQNDRLIEFQVRQEERDKLQQAISTKQLAIAEIQKEIANHQLMIVERNQEITETALRDEYQPNFEIVSLLQPGNEKEEAIKLKRQSFIRGYDHEFKAWFNSEEKAITLYVNFENKSSVDAYDVSIAEVVPKFWYNLDDGHYTNLNERQNLYYKNLFITTFDHIPPCDGKVMSFVLSEDEDSIVVQFTIIFRNAYHHWFYQDVDICIGRGDNRFECQLLINNSKHGKRDVREHGIVQYKDGTFLQYFSSRICEYQRP